MITAEFRVVIGYNSIVFGVIFMILEPKLCMWHEIHMWKMSSAEVKDRISVFSS